MQLWELHYLKFLWSKALMRHISCRFPETCLNLSRLLLVQPSRLSEYTTFSRITISRGVRSFFRPVCLAYLILNYGTEVVQLRRKCGDWNAGDGEKSLLICSLICRGSQADWGSKRSC